MSPGKHVKDTSWCANHYVWSFSLELMYFVADIGPTNAGMACCSHVVTQSQNNFLDLRRGDKSKRRVRDAVMAKQSYDISP